MFFFHDKNVVCPCNIGSRNGAPRVWACASRTRGVMWVSAEKLLGGWAALLVAGTYEE
ncbi:hypothetical protein QG053_09000 [Kingella kingae]|uniref:hypothetical protein n=1 Tax=Kingella kingae TaxID=504 RepID=UPI002550F803|nr:hypothetical protein [Kingella kingae]MDK4565171.1 hypothetical protein [Kingella kingae]MDK4577709.1 hypothetical protein [Kingella kingae]